MNASQKKIIIAAIIVITVWLLIWAGYGAEFFSKDRIPVTVTDELFGTTRTEWEDKFVLGLIPHTLGLIFITVVAAGTAFFLKRTKK